MNERNDTPPRDPLADAWHRASDADGGAPSPRVRAAILAEARAQAEVHGRRGRMRTTPSSTWRMAAALSGVGLAAVLALIVWRGQPTPLPEPATRAVQPAAPGMALERESASDRDLAGARAADEQQAASAAREPAPSRARAAPPAAPLIAESSLPGASNVAAPVAAVAPVPQQRATPVDGPTAATQAFAPRALAAPSAMAAELRADEASPRIADEPMRLLERYFPDALAQADARDWQYWLVIDAAGRSLRQGRRRADASPPLAEWLRQSVPESRGAALDRQRVDDPRGGSIDLLVIKVGTQPAMAR